MDLFYDIFWTSVGAILGLMLALHIFRRFAAPYRLYLYLESGKVVKINVKDFNSSSSRMSWTASKYSKQYMTVTDFGHVQVLKAVDRRYSL